ncbi:lytic polysaccharide monooxygenase [Streptomyces hygroscopicus subsp. hygroscopicus]|uniref:lytic polysaccharide monooxygenase auxiliary activity family 9 protein n=1 Tax=Streptomyces hygroscopicus TaxID=1912 RepID=UPI001C6594D5|nr:lytic polysaccharide monooxygenase [Streptomyces hygroscopicus]MBW8091701.1 lytic polysaccharide monooxygenase [Streptomyces hygroscopicus subsp. hygroscopicus]
MTARATAYRRTARIAVLGVVPLALTMLASDPADAHGSMQDPVSRVSACFAEGPESPDSAACKAAVAAGGTQALYDWNEVNIPDAAGRHKQIIPDGKLCSAGRDKYKGLDLPRADWPATAMTAGEHTFTYRATAPHRGSFELYITKDGYDPTKPLTWADLEAEPFAKVTDPTLQNGSYVFTGNVPSKSGRHLIYSVWQRSDSPEAFYTCSDVTFGGAGAAASKGAGTKADSAPTAVAPDDAQIAAGAEKSTVDHHGHGGDDGTDGTEAAHQPRAADGKNTEGKATGGESSEAKGAEVMAAGTGERKASAADGQRLAETGSDDSTGPMAIGGAAVLAAGAAVLFTVGNRRKAARRGRG